MDSKRTCFISDAHFGIPVPGYEDRESFFFRFLDREAHDFSDLFIVGDLFDFWIEYRYAIRPDYFQVLHYLKKLTDAGVSVHYLAGNHDFALGSFLERTCGFTIHPGPVTRTIQGKRVFLFHGDGVIASDFGYRILKRVLRNQLLQRCYRLLHPNIGVPLGSFVSGSSRKYLNRSLSGHLLDQYRSYARSMLEKGNDIVILGHNHHPEIIEFSSGVYCNTGAWLKHYTYAVMHRGELSLLRFHDGADAGKLSTCKLK